MAGARRLLGDPEWGHLEVFETTAERIEQYDVVEALVAEAVAGFTVDEFLAAAHEPGVPACHGPRARPRCWRGSSSCRGGTSRHGWSTAQVPAPTTPASPIRIRGVEAPAACSRRLGEHTAEVLAAWDPRPRPSDGGPRRRRHGAARRRCGSST